MSKYTDQMKDLLMLLRSNRQNGKTTAVCEWALKNDAVVLAATAQEERRLKKEHGVKVRSYEFEALAGRSNPAILDHFTTENIIARLVEEVEKTEASVDNRLLRFEKNVADQIRDALGRDDQHPHLPYMLMDVAAEHKVRLAAEEKVEELEKKLEEETEEYYYATKMEQAAIESRNGWREQCIDAEQELLVVAEYLGTTHPNYFNPEVLHPDPAEDMVREIKRRDTVLNEQVEDIAALRKNNRELTDQRFALMEEIGQLRGALRSILPYEVDGDEVRALESGEPVDLVVLSEDLKAAFDLAYSVTSNV